MTGSGRDPRSGEPPKKRGKPNGDIEHPHRRTVADPPSTVGASASAEQALPAAPGLPAELSQQIQSFTMGQLFHLLRHIKKLAAQAPAQAQILLVQHPPICHALLHAECLAGTIEEPVMPIENAHLQRAKMKAKEMQEVVESYKLPPPPEEAPFGQQAFMMPPAGLPDLMPGSMPKFPGILPPVLAPPKAMPLTPGQTLPGGTASALQMPVLLPQQSVLGGSVLPSNPTILPPPQVPGMPGLGSAPVALPGVSPPAGALAGLASMAPPVFDAQTKTLLNKLVTMSPEQIEQLPEGTKFQVFEFLRQQQQQQH